jgi:predicted RNA polymerase sigma factor
VRAKTKIRAAGIPFRIPEQEELRTRLATVLDAIYAAFSEGWADAAGTDVTRRDLAEEAIFLCRVVTELLPSEPEGLGLLALMLHAEARRPARRSPDGDYIPLAEHDPTLWRTELIDIAEGALLHASTMGFLGRYQLEAAIQSAHVARRKSRRENWDDIVKLYDALQEFAPSPVLAINRALAVAEIEGASAALTILDERSTDPRLAHYQPYWAARADLLARSGNKHEAHAAYERAIGLTQDPAIRRFLLKRQFAVQ